MARLVENLRRTLREIDALIGAAGPTKRRRAVTAFSVAKTARARRGENSARRSIRGGLRNETGI
jgi:hypothetical protein